MSGRPCYYDHAGHFLPFLSRAVTFNYGAGMRPRLLPLALLLCASIASAQIGLPAVRMPQLPGAGLPAVPQLGLTLDPDKSAAQLATEVDPRELSQLRSLRIRALLRRHGDVLETDPHGALMVRGEVLALAPQPQSLEAAAAAGFSVRREWTLPTLGLKVVVLHVSSGTARALKRLQSLDPDGAYDFNHVYTDSGGWGSAAVRHAPAPAEPPAAAGSGAGEAGEAALGVGLIDSGVASDHEVFAGVIIRQHGCTDQPLPAGHGTAVASLLVGHAAALHGAAPGATLFAADVFCGQPTGGAVDAVAEAFEWLLRQRVAVINVSLVGPPNRVLESVVRNALARGHLIVAAVGNDGPAAPPLYPAAWPGVLGVTAVDAHQRVLVEAERGPQVKFAAPGADLAAAALPRGYALVRGTSFAAPIVAGLLARELLAPDIAAAQAAVTTLAQRALDLGLPGPDPVYGYGLVGAELRDQPALAAARAH
jgi:subtilisin family serine protease